MVLLASSGDSTPMLIGRPPMWHSAGQGNFTCCDRNHEIDGHGIGGDKEKVHAILSSMLRAKTAQAEPEEKGTFAKHATFEPRRLVSSRT